MSFARSASPVTRHACRSSRGCQRATSRASAGRSPVTAAATRYSSKMRSLSRITGCNRIDSMDHRCMQAAKRFNRLVLGCRSCLWRCVRFSWCPSCAPSPPEPNAGLRTGHLSAQPIPGMSPLVDRNLIQRPVRRDVARRERVVVELLSQVAATVGDGPPAAPDRRRRRPDTVAVHAGAGARPWGLDRPFQSLPPERLAAPESRNE